MDHSEIKAMALESEAMVLSAPSRRRRRRRRPTSTTTATKTAVTTALPLASLLLYATIATAGARDDSGGGDNHSRRIEEMKQETLAKWRSLQDSGYDLTKLRPLDLVLDETDQMHQRVYQKGAGGFLEPYDFENYQDGFGGTLNLAELMGDAGSSNSISQSHEHGHHSSSRLGHTNFDLHRGIGINHDDNEDEVTSTSERRQSLRGLASVPDKEEEQEKQQQPQPSYDSFFRYTEENDPEELEEYEVFDPSVPVETLDRRLQASHHTKSSSSAQGFANHDSSSSSTVQDGRTNTHTDTNTNNNNQGEETIEEASAKRDTTPPIIRAAFPPHGTSIGGHQTFGALVKDDYGVKIVTVQFKDHLNKRSKSYSLENVSANYGNDRRRRLGRNNNNSNSNNNGGGSGYSTSDVWELSFDGFGTFAGKEWAYRIKSTDGSRNKKSTPWRKFAIDERAAGADDGGQTGTEATSATSATTAATQAPPPAAVSLTEEVRDEDWPHDGVVKLSTGRIMFFFDNHPYVCSGTVLEDTPNDRTVIVTAGHCVYQFRRPYEGGGRFAEHALYIPNQVDTRSARSNDVCTDDPLGCWVPAFGVVHYEWTTKSFPDSVPWDYAYYVIPNDPSAHQGGFIHEGQPNLSKILDDIVEPMPIDFGWSLNNAPHLDLPGEFTHGLGYSFDKDPAFRYCATSMTTKWGIDAYENLWLASCELTGGSSGGPWMRDVDSSGRGTVISVNSWGYAQSPGMGGPNFNTAEGGNAECLFGRAKNARFEDVVNRGIVVSDC